MGTAAEDLAAGLVVAIGSEDQSAQRTGGDRRTRCYRLQTVTGVERVVICGDEADDLVKLADLLGA